MRAWLIIAFAAAACSGGSSAKLNISGRWASALELHGSDGSLSTLYAMWGSLEVDVPNAGGSYAVDDNWQLCNLTLPGPLVVPFDDAGLAQLIFAGTPASLSGTRFTQSALAMTVDDPGVRATATGLSPDADTVEVDFSLSFGFAGTVDAAASTLDGTLSGVSLDSHVIGCHLRSGTDCGASDVAALEAARPRVSWTGGAIRSHFQGDYFSCPEFLADPEGSLSGRELMDAGAGDAGLGTASFSLIQDDVDYMGCATGNCHETRTAANQLHLWFQPSTPARLRENHDAIVPWTSGAAGGRFVNEVPLPAPMHARWMEWISAGAPL